LFDPIKVFFNAKLLTGFDFPIKILILLIFQSILCIILD
jgi:hypothetical protein